jgi:hypothetical protein
MNWIETLLHIAPDHGDGAFEALLLLILLAPLGWRCCGGRLRSK